MSSLQQTVVRFTILFSVLIVGLLLVLSATQQDWMREKLTMKISPLKEMFKSFESMNMTNVDITMLKKVIEDPNEISPSAAIEFTAHCGLRTTCFYVTVIGLRKPLQAMVPKIVLCLDNAIFSDPQKHGFPLQMKMFEKEQAALKNAFICIVTALVCIAVALVVVLVKCFKWMVPCLVSSLVICLIAAVCIVAGLCVIHTEFKFKSDFDQIKKISSMSANHRTRRDDGSTGYGGEYKDNDNLTGKGSQQKALMAGAGILMREMELKESFGPPAAMCGVAIALLLLVAILSIFEYYSFKKNGEADVKYLNVALT